MIQGLCVFLLSLPVLCLPANELAALPDTVIETGRLSQYALHVMPPVVEARQSWQHLPADLSYVDGFVATWNCDYIGRTALLSIEAPEWADWQGWSEYQVVMVSDCSGHKSTTDWMISENIVFEISGELAAYHGVTCLCPLNGRVIWLD